MDTLTQENVVLSQNEPILPENPKKFNFLIILLSVLLFISTSIAVFFAYQTQKLVKELVILEKSSMPISTVEPIMTSELTENWKTYPSSTTIGLPYSFKYPMTTEMNEAQDLVYLKTGNATIFHRFLDKQTDLQSAMNNFKPWGTNESVVFSDDKKQVSYGLLAGYKLTSSDGNNTFLFLGSNNLSGILVFHHPTVETSSGELLNQIISTFKFKDLETVNWKTYVDITNKFEIKYPSDWTTAKETKNKDSYTQIVDLAKTVESTFYNSDGKHALWISYIKNPNNLSLNQIIKSGMLDKNYGTLSTSFANEDVKFTELNIGNNKVYYPDINKWPSAFGIRSVFILNPSNNSYAWINLEPREDSSLDPIMDQIISTFEFTN